MSRLTLEALEDRFLPSTSIYVSPTGDDSNDGSLAAPFRTLAVARDYVRTINQNMSDNINVYLRGGTYIMPTALVLNQQDSGTNGFNVLWQAYQQEVPVISGGQQISGWTLGANGIYSAPTGGLNFLQFYVNGVRETMARTNWSTMSWNTSARTINISSADATLLSSLTPSQLSKVRITIPGNGVNQATLRVASISGTTLTPQEPERTLIFGQQYPVKVNRPYFLDNALAFLDTPGEFFVDSTTSTVYYKPKPNDDLSKTTAPRLDEVLHIQGTLDAPVQNVQFYGLTFQETTWLTPLQGFIGDQASTQYVAPLPPDQITSYPSLGIQAAIYVGYAHNLRFERNVIQNTGASAINFWIDVDSTTFIGNRVQYIAASGISVDLNLQGNPSDLRKICVGNTIKDNYFSDIGLDYYQSVPIMASYTNSITIEHNEIANSTYSGISVGWGWADVSNAAQNNVIRYNKIHNVLNLMSDGGGIYTLSRQPGTLIAENYIYNISRNSLMGSYPIAAIYLDQGSDLITVRDNVGVNIQDTMINQNVNGPGNTFSNNNGSSPTTISNSGIEPAYQDIIPLPPPPPPSLVASYNFDAGSGSILLDNSGNGNNGTIFGATWTIGKNGGALSFNGTNNYVSVPDSNTLDLTNGMTLEAWVYPTATGTLWRNVLIKERVGGEVYNLYANTDLQNPDTYIVNQSGNPTGAHGGSQLPLNTWSFLTSTYDGSILRLYVNATQVASTTVSGNMISSNEVLRIGGNSIWGEYFAGKIDDIRIYSTALSQSDIQIDMNTPVGSQANKNTSTSLTSSANPSAIGQMVNFTATVSGSSIPTGTVSFVEGPNTLASVVVDSTGRAVFSTDTLGAGSHIISANFVGTNGWIDSNSNTVSQLVGNTTSTTIVGSPNPSAFGQDVVFTATVSGSSIPTGTVTFVEGTTTLASVVVDANGYASFNTAALSVGNHTIVANFVGTNGWFNSSNSISESITGLTSNTSVTGSPNPSVFGQNVIFTATITGSGNPIGTVNFVEGANTLASVVVDSAGHASFNTAILNVGTHTITANFVGTNGWANSSGNTIETVQFSTANLVASYNFNEGSGSILHDLSGNGNNGTIFGATWTTGKNGGALSFNGTSNYVSIPDSSSLDLTTGMTLEAWVNPSGTGNVWRNVLIKERPNGECYNLYANTNFKAPAVYVVLASNGTPQDARGTSQVQLNAWTHLAATFDSSTLKIYVNGVLKDSTSMPGSILTSNGVLRIGGNSIWGEFFKGKIDDVRIYNVALSAAQIQSDMNTGVSISSPILPQETSTEVASTTLETPVQVKDVLPDPIKQEVSTQAINAVFTSAGKEVPEDFGSLDSGVKGQA